MSISFISGSKINNNSGTIVGIGNNIRDDFKTTSTANIIVNGASIVFDGDNIDAINNSVPIAYNNNKPIIMQYTNTLSGIEDSTISGNNPINNRSKIIRSTLTSTAIREGKYNFINNAFDTNYPENTSYNLCANVFTTTYQTGKQIPVVRNDNPSDCDQFYVPPTPTIMGYVADSSFGVAEGTYCPAGTYGNSPYYAGKNSDGSSNGWLMYFDADLYGWMLSQTDTPGVDSLNGYSANGNPDAPALTGWYGETAADLTLTSGTVCFE